MKTVCVYHSIDLDGWMSAAIVKHWFKNNKSKTNDDPLKSCNIFKEQGCSHVDGMLCNTKECDMLHGTLDFIGYNYGQPIPDLSEYDKVIMCDISFPKEEMYELCERRSDNYPDFDFVYIDHHISAINDLKKSIINSGTYTDYPDGLRDTKYSACELTWIYFFPSFSSKSQWEGMPEIVRLLGRYDCFGHKGTNEEQKVLEFQYGARAVISNYEEAYNYLIESIKREKIKSTKGSIEWEIQENGKAIYSYLCQEAKQVYKNGFTITFDNVPDRHPMDSFVKYYERKFICINKERFNPINFGIDYHKDGYDGAACFHRTKDGRWAFSLYNDNGKVDCSQIAKQFGGGGHKGAAGFIIDDINKIIKNGSI